MNLPNVFERYYSTIAFGSIHNDSTCNREDFTLKSFVEPSSARREEEHIKQK